MKKFIAINKIKKLRIKFNKWIIKQSKIDPNQINIIFLGLTFLTLALVQVIVSVYLNTMTHLNKSAYLISALTLILILVSIFYLIFKGSVNPTQVGYFFLIDSDK